TLGILSAGMIVTRGGTVQRRASHVPVEEPKRIDMEPTALSSRRSGINDVRAPGGMPIPQRSSRPKLCINFFQFVKSSLQNGRFYKASPSWSKNESFSKVSGCVDRLERVSRSATALDAEARSDPKRLEDQGTIPC